MFVLRRGTRSIYDRVPFCAYMKANRGLYERNRVICQNVLKKTAAKVCTCTGLRRLFLFIYLIFRYISLLLCCYKVSVCCWKTVLCRIKTFDLLFLRNSESDGLLDDKEYDSDSNGCPCCNCYKSK